MEALGADDPLARCLARQESLVTGESELLRLLAEAPANPLQRLSRGARAWLLQGALGMHLPAGTRLASEGGYDQLRPSLGPFLSLVWREPRSLTELARELSMSRQGCTKLLRVAEEAGYAERVDGGPGERAQHVRLTARGRRLVDDAVRMILDAETTYAERIGEARLSRFRAAAAALTLAPLSASARRMSSDLLRSAGCQRFGLACVMVIGRLEISIASKVERSAEWLMSTTSPTRFISRMTSRPMRVMPGSSAS